MDPLADLGDSDLSPVADAMAWADACRANGNLAEAALWDAEVERLVACGEE